MGTRCGPVPRALFYLQGKRPLYKPGFTRSTLRENKQEDEWIVELLLLLGVAATATAAAANNNPNVCRCGIFKYACSVICNSTPRTTAGSVPVQVLDQCLPPYSPYFASAIVRCAAVA